MRVLWVTSLLIMGGVIECYAFDDVYYYQSIASDRILKESIYKGWMIKFGYWEGFPKEIREKLQEWGTAGKKLGSLFEIKSAALKFDSPQSASEIEPFVQEFNINRSESLIPIESFTTFNQFFYRQLKPGARIIDDRSGVLVAPADSKLRILSGGTTGNPTKFYIKQQEFDLDSFLDIKTNFNHAYLVTPYNNNLWDLMVFRLAPTDYHRFHFPCDGKVVGIIELDKKKTKYGSVSPIAYRAGRWPISENYRVMLQVVTKNFGPMLMVIVGAAGTNTIELTFGTQRQRNNLKNGCDWSNPSFVSEDFQGAIEVCKGQECGYFAFGGSTICLLCKKNFVIFPSVLIHRSLFQEKRNEQKEPYETAIKVGQGFGVWANESNDIVERLATQNYLDQLDPLLSLKRTSNKKSYFYVTDVSDFGAQLQPKE